MPDQTDIKAPKMPAAPRGLRPAGRKLWRQINAEYEFGPGELELVEVACRALERLREAEDLLDRDGIVVAARYGTKAHPAVVIARDAGQTLARSLRQLGIKLEDELVKVPRRGGGRRSTVRRPNAGGM
jgi:phage terminase small subunit